MDAEFTYPIEVLVPSNGRCELVRLATAIHIACIDAGGAFFDVEFKEDELQDYFDTHPHRYFEVTPRGGISTAFKRLTKAVNSSLKSGSLKLAVTRVDLAEKVCLLNSWVSTSDFENWCESRSIDLGESWSELFDEEQTVAIKASDAGENYRRMLEGQNSSYDVRSVTDEFEGQPTTELYSEISILRAKLSKLETAAIEGDKPLKTKERNTLLCIIAALCKEVNFDYTKHSKTAGLILSTAAQMGVSLGETTIEGHLKKIPDALEGRMK